ncbi:hypothetical protein MGG_03267 [Pyricularia oryzae 70-15]|uniref:Vacuolar protein sorting-associated protein 51 homolog n=3 Tax=Pyricularia oryzae TaxID=318829 RepID=G4N9I8_PYRO7|nr:uncharacterized protein MGG_03267 [Pyricularia oryzae 70-15]EHA50380.1 hypothetical protein MGG_03267 [Pyricularia oryzae 70-15]ELQ34545.1 hypothetical protein OOU_Y34scaffold00765g91 [Pyricularia oryzae Y34]KAI7931498.1 hypothetical protein M9X92_000329 [Pyricularia oryzae]KAI7931621.1 hypothetical protein M0657_001119 [Pyricularia oryzae]
MSTIATPREAPRRIPSSQTPTSSTRPSFDNPRSQAASPNRGTASSPAAPLPAGGGAGAAKRNRAALREYYKIKNAVPPTLEVTDETAPGDDVGHSEVPASELDAPGFDPQAYVAKAAAESSLTDLLRTYARVLGETRALDAEKKALVYDNYSKLITATETIRKMRENMDPLNPMASTLDPAIAYIYTQASSIRDTMRKNLPRPEERSATAADAERRKRTRELAMIVLATPARLHELVAEGKHEEAEREWELPRRLLVSWKERGLGGDDVATCLDAGDAALRSVEDEREEGDDDDDDDDEGEEEDEEDEKVENGND